LTQASALFALEHMAWFEERALEICAERATLSQRLSELPGVELFPSAANFLLLRVGHGCAGAVFDGLCKKKVLIKNLHGTHASLVDCLRVTIGTAEQNGVFFNALKEQLVAD
jgi:histidinol-phosphate aminotransferase